jgi:hypothetical protein
VSRIAALVAMELRRLARRPWIQLAAGAGVALAIAAVGVAATHEDLAREDSLRRGAATLLLLGGLAFALALGSGALNNEALTGRFGALTGAGASRPEIVAGSVGARAVVLAVTGAAWAAVLEIGSLALGLGWDGPLAVHAAAVGVGLLMAMLAASAASAVVGPAASFVFGASMHILSQAVVNLKAAADQDLIGTASGYVRALYYIAPRAVTSPMIADMQLRDVAGPAAPRVEINHNTVFVHAASWQTVAWTLAWCVLLALLCGAGLRRRPFN